MGLRPGTEYDVVLKVFQFYYVVCTDTDEARTVPDASQIVVWRAISSTSIMVQWTKVPSAEHYQLMVISQGTGQVWNQTYTNQSAVVGNLQPSTNFDCYITTVNNAGMGSKSKVRTITTLVNPPPGVTASQTGLGTARVTWQPVEDVLLYRVALQDIDEPNSPPSVYNVTDTKLDVQGILPCSTYLISVSSFNKFLVPSEPTDYTYTTNKLTPVSSVSVDYTCTSNSAEVHWTTVFGADSYKAIAVGENGTELMCTSQGTSCQINALSCGQSYVVHVTPTSESCTNMMNTTTATFQTVPCPPKNLDLVRDCASEVIIFSWEHTNNTDHYMAKAVDSQNLRTAADCSADVLLSVWDLAEGALRYTVEAYGNRGTNSQYNCSSMSNSCAIQGLHCGEYLSVYITAFDDECASPRTLGPVAETIPCAPQNVTAVKECGADAITVTWIGSSAIFYVASAKDSDGNIHSCNSFDMMCKIEGLQCGTNYTANVIATNLICNSTESETVAIETAACPPDQVTASLDCAANEALVSWNGQPRINSYTATIVDEQQRLLSCSSTNTSCRIPDLKCGQLYTVTVGYHDGICPSMPSEAIYMESVPCGPSAKADLDCRSGELTIGWNASSKAEGYMTEITSSVKKMTYNTTEHVLKVDTLECGLDYTVKVMSFNSTCVSHPSVLPVGKAPCPPSQLNASVNCANDSAVLTWSSSPNAVSYIGKAVSTADTT
nr:fibronectin type III domain-containing protein 7-like [Labrus bergylta]